MRFQPRKNVQVVYAGHGSADNFAAVDAHDKLALITVKSFRGCRVYNDQLDNAINAGAVGVLFDSTDAAQPYGQCALPLFPAYRTDTTAVPDIPFAQLDVAHVKPLMALLAHGTVKADIDSYPANSPYLRYVLSYRDVEELLAERGIEVDHVTVYRWVQTFTPEFIDAARPARHATSDRWFIDKAYVKVAGRWTYLYRPVDQQGQVIDVLVSQRRDARAARTFFTRALKHGPAPVEVTTDRAPVPSRHRRARAGRVARHRAVQQQQRGG